MSGEKGPKISVDIGLGAKANLQTRISTEIPAPSAGRFLDTLTDMIRPFSERRGLKADMIRLQREEVAIEIARRARHRSEIENQPINPLPNKFLVPFLEKASLEELDNVMIDRWADLLASAAADPHSAHPYFVQILSHITGKDAQLLDTIARNCIDYVERPFQVFHECEIFYSPMRIRAELHKRLRGLQTITDLHRHVDLIYDKFIELFESPGVSLIDITISGKDDEYWSLNLDGYCPPASSPKLGDNLDVLYSLNLLRSHEIHLRDNRCEIDVFYLYITSLCSNLLTMCDLELKRKLNSRP